MHTCIQEKHDCLCSNVHKSPLPRSVNPLPVLVACFVVRGAATALPSNGGTELKPDCRDVDSPFASNPSASITVNIALWLPSLDYKH